MSDEEWPPHAARARAGLWEAERHLLRADYLAAATALDSSVAHGDRSTASVARGLRRLATAGYRGQTGDPERARRQLACARRDLAPFLPVFEEVDLEALLGVVAAPIES